MSYSNPTLEQYDPPPTMQGGAQLVSPPPISGGEEGATTVAVQPGANAAVVAAPAATAGKRTVSIANRGPQPATLGFNPAVSKDAGRRLGVFEVVDFDTLSGVWAVGPELPDPSPLGTIAFRAATTVTGNAVSTVAINVPAGVQNGDTLLLAVLIGTGTTNINTPAGWTLLDTSSNGTASDPKLAIFTRTANAEPASYNVTITVAAQICVVMQSYVGADPVTPVFSHSAQNSGLATSATATTPAGAQPSLPVGVAFLVWFGQRSNVTWTKPSPNWAERADIQAAGALCSLEAADLARRVVANGPAPPGPFSATATGAGKWVAALVVIQAPSAAVGRPKPPPPTLLDVSITRLA